MFRSALVPIFLAAAIPSMSTAQEDVRTAWDQFFTAYTGADAEAITSLFSPDAVFYGTSAQEPVDQEGVRQYFADAFEGREPGSIPGTVVGGADDHDGDRRRRCDRRQVAEPGHARRQDGDQGLRVTAVLADRGEGWQIVQFHNSRLPE